MSQKSVNFPDTQFDVGGGGSFYYANILTAVLKPEELLDHYRKHFSHMCDLLQRR